MSILGSVIARVEDLDWSQVCVICVLTDFKQVVLPESHGEVCHSALAILAVCIRLNDF